MNLNKYKYLINSVLHYKSPVVCPSCHSSHHKLIDRKYFFTRLFACLNCRIYYRHPIETIKANRSFYQTEYSQADGITTFLPEEDSLEKLMKDVAQSPDNPKNTSRIKEIIKELIPNKEDVKVIDYGASWGYITRQLKSYGMDVQGFEISIPRAQYGNEHLGVDIKTDEEMLRKENDIFFNSHVIEHVPSVSKMLELAKQLLNANGYIVTLCPNGSPEYQKRDPDGFHKCWGQVHPNYINADFLMQYFNVNPIFLTSTPFDLKALHLWDKTSHFIGNMSGDEMLAIILPHQDRL